MGSIRRVGGFYYSAYNSIFLSQIIRTATVKVLHNVQNCSRRIYVCFVVYTGNFIRALNGSEKITIVKYISSREIYLEWKVMVDIVFTRAIPLDLHLRAYLCGKRPVEVVLLFPVVIILNMIYYNY